MYAIVEVGGKQYKVEKDMRLFVDKLRDFTATTMEIDKVLLIADGEKVSVGKPYLSGAKVSASVIGMVKGRKVRGFKFIRRKKYRRKLGHRQQYFDLKIENIKTA
jgi:large subunit ribosomal protein L21